ncbi:MAG: hypothetical protein SNJ68_02690 [Cyanobacteriota bacterium]
MNANSMVGDPVTTRSARNRKRSQRRQIFCPIHGCFLDSVSPKYPLFADSAGQLQVRGMGIKTSRLVMSAYKVVPLVGEWIEEFWCSECQESKWYHIRKIGERNYEVRVAKDDLWQNASKVVNPHQNPSVSEYTFRVSRGHSACGVKGFAALR